MTNNNNPWAGLASYEDPSKSERRLKFCGRDNDIYDVTRLIDDNLLLILYGKSGIGKTSLLNAGVFPKLRLEQYLPVSIRLGTLEADAPYQESVISAIENAIEEIHGNNTVYDVVEEQADNQQPDRLWNYFTRHRFVNAEQQPLFPVVVLDQFEEVLRNISPEHVGKAQILLNQLQYLIDESHALSDCIVDGKDYFYDFNFRFVISIREDELYLLEDNIDDLSLSMFRNCRYRLRSLSEQGAKEAILVPGKDCISEREKQAVVNRVIALSKRPQSNDIDTLLLSLVCSGTFNKKAGEKITLSDLAIWNSNPMEVYYQDAVKGLPADHVRYIQQHLIREDGSRRRVDAEEVKAALGEASYRQLTLGDNRLLTLGDKGQVELLHDLLGLAVFEERKTAEEQKRKQKKRRITMAFFLGLTLIASFCIYFAQNQILKQQRWKLIENQARYVAEKCLGMVEENSYLAQILAIEVLPDDLSHTNKPYTIEAEKALRKSVSYNTAILKGHESQVNDVNYSPDGKFIISASSDNTIRLWDAYTGLLLHTFYGHMDTVNTASFSFNGELIVSASHDNTIRIWDTMKKCLILSLNGHSSQVNSAVFSPDGKSIVSASNDSTIRIWNSATGEETHKKRHMGKVNSVCYSSDGKRIASAASDRTIRIWDAYSGEEIQVLEFGENFDDVTFCLNDEYVAAVSSTGDIFMIEIKTGNELKQWRQKRLFADLLRINSSFYNPLSGTVQVGKKQQKNSQRPKYYVTYCPAGNKIIYNSANNTVFIVNERGSVKTTIKDRPISNSASISPDGKHIVFAYSDNTIGILEIEPCQISKSLKGHTGVVNTADFSPDNKRIVSTSDDGTIRIWDMETGRELMTIMGHTDFINSAAFSPDGKRIVSASDDGTVRIWDAETGLELRVLKGHTLGVNSAAFNPDGKRIVSASDNGTISIWDTETGRKLMVLEGHAYLINSVAFSPDGKRIVSASADRTVKIWDAVNERRKMHKMYTLIGHTDIVYSAAFSPDGKRIVSASADQTVRIWDAETAIELKTLEGHTGPVYYSAFSPDGQHIISASFDKTVRIWKVESGRELEFVEHTAPVNSAVFSPDGKSIVSACDDRNIKIWSFPPLQDLIDQTRERFKDRPLTPEERKKYYLE